jgi:hypothetical protein
MKFKKIRLLQSIGLCLSVICFYLIQVAPTLAADMPSDSSSNLFELESLNTFGNTYLMDKHAWTLFAKLNQKAPIQCSDTNNTIWETWADNAETFPGSQPTWPEVCGTAEKPRLKVLRERSINLFLKEEEKPIIPGVEFVSSSVEEVRRNRTVFDYILNKDLWNLDGLVKAYASDEKIDFPADAIELKADWVSIRESEKSKYHWNYTQDGTLVGLRAMHIITKELPNWFWATFEWVDNLGRCDEIGCMDNFGVTSHIIRPNNTSNLKYATEQLTPELEKLFAAYGLTGEWGEQFKNYRLKGTQINFIDSTGNPTLLGNSITEQNAVFGSSCITCHAQARIDASGHAARVFTLVGAPEPELFKNLKSTGFVWSIPMCVNYPWACQH